ncbi:hypothetical protein AA313_de0204074 [Arthrobotrys entomopaga]|nr:hypothetical protein AA313_de0204074 [Arthrobotrys entomopaga]
MTADTASPPAEEGSSQSNGDKAASKPLARSREPTPSPDEPSRKKQRPDNNDRSPTPHLSTSSESERKPRESATIDEKKDKVDGVEDYISKDLTENETSTVGSGNEEDEEDEEDEDEEEEEEEEEEEGELPPLPPGPPPEEASSDGWEAIWEPGVGQYYFYNHHTGETTWTNPRVPPSESKQMGPGSTTGDEVSGKQYAGYDPAIHGDYDPTAPYAQQPERTPSPTVDPYVAHAAFNRFTGRFQTGPGAERHTDESRARRQMEIYFDVDAAANCHDGRSLKAERQAKKLTKKEVKAFREKTRLKKEEKKRAWLRD